MKLLADELTSFVNPQTLDAKTAWNRAVLCEYLKGGESFVLGLQQIGLRPFGVLVRNLCAVLVTPEGLWS